MSFLRNHWSKVAVLAIPLGIALTNTAWLGNPIGDADVWIYNGYFKALRTFAANRAAWGPAEYFETRLPIIVPGAIVYSLFSEATAKIILNLCILHGIVALSLWHVVRTHLSRAAATCATALLVTDVFYLRTMGWDYVDNAVLAYQALTFALLTSRGPSPGATRLAAAGFSAMSMLAVHLASAPMLAIFVVYSLFFHGARLGSLARRIAWAGAGGILCLVVYGAISALVLHGPFAFWLEQLQGGLRHAHPAEYASSLRERALHGYWLTIHAATMVASILAIAVQRVWVGHPLRRFGCFCFWTTAVTYSLLVIGEGLKLSFFLFRSGLYSSQFLFLSYLTAAALFFGGPPARRTPSWVVIGVLLVSPALAITKLAIGDGVGLANCYPQPMYVIAISMAIFMIIAFAAPRTIVLVGTVSGFGALCLFVPWQFERDDTILEARSYILESGASPPRLFYAESDPQRLVLVSIASALTDHVVHDHYDRGARPIARGDRIVVLESGVPGDPFDEIPCTIEGLRPLAARQFDRRYFTVAIHLFEALRWIPRQDVHCPVRPEATFAPIRRLGGWELPSETGRLRGELRIASEGSASTGYATYGPYGTLPAGTYRVTFHYSATQRLANAHRFDIAGTDGGRRRLIGGGQLPDTAGDSGVVAVTFRLPTPIEGFEARTFFSGAGELSIAEITVDRRTIPR